MQGHRFDEDVFFWAATGEDKIASPYFAGISFTDFLEMFTISKLNTGIPVASDKINGGGPKDSKFMYGTE